MEEDLAHQSIFQSAFFLWPLLFLSLSVGCAPKKIVQPPAHYEADLQKPAAELPPFPPQYSPKPSLATKHSEQLKADTPIADLLLLQYQNWKKVPHRTGGMDRWGLDCSGLLVLIFRDAFDIDLPRTSREQSQMGYAVKPQHRRPGDLVFFKDRGLNHIGVVVDEHQFLHTSSKRGVSLSKFDSYWKPRLRCVRRVLDE